MRGIISATPPPMVVELSIHTVRSRSAGTSSFASLRSPSTCGASEAKDA